MTSLAHQSSSFLMLRPSTTTTTRRRRTIIRRNQPSRLIISSEMKPKARFVARRRETLTVEQQQRPLLEYMKLPASQYSVLDAERIERIDDNTFRCFVYRFKFLAFEVCPVLVVRVNEHPLGTCINLLSCKLEGSPIVVAQNEKFEGMLPIYLFSFIRTYFLLFSYSYLCPLPIAHCPLPIAPCLTYISYGKSNAASMENLISCDTNQATSGLQQLSSDALIQVSIEIPFPFTTIPVETIESTGTQVLQQILGIMLPRFMKQLVKDYEAWASGDTSRQPLGTGQI